MMSPVSPDFPRMGHHTQLDYTRLNEVPLTWVEKQLELQTASMEIGQLN